MIGMVQEEKLYRRRSAMDRNVEIMIFGKVLGDCFYKRINSPLKTIARWYSLYVETHILWLGILPTNVTHKQIQIFDDRKGQPPAIFLFSAYNGKVPAHNWLNCDNVVTELSARACGDTECL